MSYTSSPRRCCVYVALYSPDFYRAPTEVVNYLLNPPFTHVELCWDPSLLPPDSPRWRRIRPYNLRFTTIVFKSKGVVVEARDFPNPNFYWVRVPCSQNNLAKLDERAVELSKQSAYCSMMCMARSLTSYPASMHPRGAEHERRWFCSQLVAYLLQTIGKFPKEFNTYGIRPTDVFVILLYSGEGVAVQRPMPYSPRMEVPNELPLDALELYCAALSTKGVTRKHFDAIPEVKRFRYTDALCRERGGQ